MNIFMCHGKRFDYELDGFNKLMMCNSAVGFQMGITVLCSLRMQGDSAEMLTVML